MPLKILCFLASKYFYGKERSNIEVYSLLNEQDDYQLKVVYNEGADDKLKSYLSIFDTVPLKFPDRSIAKYKYLKYGYTSLRLNSKILTILVRFRPDYIFVNDERTFYDIGPSVYFFGGKVVYRIGDEPAFPQLSNYKFNAWIWKSIVLRKTDTFVYISEYIKGTVKATGRDSGKDVVIYNYPPRRKQVAKRANNKYISNSRPVVGYLGQVMQSKGVHLFVDAAIEIARKYEDVSFYVAGPLDYYVEYAENLVRKVSGAGFTDRIVFLGSIDDVQTFFGKIDVLVTPSLKEEPLGNVIVEAKKYSTPSIIFKSGGMPELITHGIDGFVCEDSTSVSIERGIEYYLQDASLIELHGQNAKDSIEELQIDYPNFSRKWLAVFNS